MNVGTPLGFTDPEGQTLRLLCVGSTSGEGWQEDAPLVAEDTCPVPGRSAAQAHLAISDLTIWRKEKI